MDARSLLRAKKAEAHIDHPFASYTATGILRCSICAIPVKQWDAHLLTKQHRTSLAREKASLAKSSSNSKRPAESNLPEGSGTKRPRVDAAAMAGGNGPKGLPKGFFSSGRPASPDEDAGEDGEEGDVVERASAAGPSTALPATQMEDQPQTGDAELDDFLASIATGDPPSVLPSLPSTPLVTLNPTGPTSQGRVLKPSRAAYREVIPGIASYEAAPIRNVPANEEVQEAAEEESEQERRERLGREEREEIMGRLEEEERAQEDADSRVTMLKQRMEILRKRREGRGTAPAQTGGKKGRSGEAHEAAEP